MSRQLAVTARLLISKLLHRPARQRAEAHLNAEIETHLELLVEEHLRKGASVTEARAAARRAFGGVAQVKETWHEQHRFLVFDSLVQDAKHAIRQLTRSRGLTVAAVAVLALSIGLNAAVFTVMSGVLFRGFRTVEDNDRLLYVTGSFQCCVSYPDYEDWAAQATSFARMGTVADLRVALSDGRGFAETCTATQITANTFAIVGRQPILGRDFTAADAMLGAAPVTILSYGLWERRYAKDPAVLGKTLRINDVPTTVVGVMPDGFAFPQNQQLWLPLVPSDSLRHREARGLWFAFGRLVAGATQESARAEMETIGRRLAAEYPLTNKDILPRVHRFHEFFIGPQALTIYGFLWAAVTLVLLVACANLANLLLARAMSRSREIAVRMSLGAGRWRIIRQFLVESLVIAGLGGLGGWWIAVWGVRTYESIANPPTRTWSDHLFDYSVDSTVFVYVVAISMAAGVLFGMAPALRLSNMDPGSALKTGSRGQAGERGTRLSPALMAGQVALTVILLASAGVMVHSFLNVYGARLGFDTENVLTGLVQLPLARYDSPEKQLAFFDELSARLKPLPGVESVAVVDSLPGGTLGRRSGYEIAGASSPGPRDQRTVRTRTVSPGYFVSLGLRIPAGRDFTSGDGSFDSPSVLVNSEFAATHWPGTSALGKQLRLVANGAPGAWSTVVGIVPNIAQNGGTVDPIVYVPSRQGPVNAMWVLARTAVPPASLAASFRREVQSMDPDLPIWIGPATLAERLSGLYWDRGLHGGLLAALAAIALLIASVGVYAVTAHSVGQRTQEIGVRMAIGASGGDIVRLVILQGAVPLAAGAMAGTAISLLVNRALQGSLVRVSPADPLTYVAVTLTLVAACALGCALPAIRALRVHPAVALRHE